MEKIALEQINIRTSLKAGDLGYVIHRHGVLYHEEYNFGLNFESYVAEGLFEFYRAYDPARDRIWICEHHSHFVGFLCLMHRSETTAQLRYFYLEPQYRGIGLGKKLMDLFMLFLNDAGYKTAYLWTTNELGAAASLYTRNGFRLTEEKPSDVFGKSLIEHRYDLEL